MSIAPEQFTLVPNLAERRYDAYMDQGFDSLTAQHLSGYTPQDEALTAITPSVVSGEAPVCEEPALKPKHLALAIAEVAFQRGVKRRLGDTGSQEDEVYTRARQRAYEERRKRGF